MHGLQIILLTFSCFQTADVSLNDPNRSSALAIIHGHYVDSVEVDSALPIDRIVRQLDPFSHYLTRKEYQAEDYSWNDQFFGYGFGTYSVNGRLVIRFVYPESVLQEAGILAGDEVIAVAHTQVGGNDSLLGAILTNATGPATDMTFHRPLTDSTFTIGIFRKVMPDPSVGPCQMLDDGTAYVILSGFHRGTGTMFERTLDSLSRCGMQRLIVDLRNNYGGFVNEALHAVKLFTSGRGAPLLTTASRLAQYRETDWASRPAKYADLPLALLVNGGTCSAAEIFAGILQDNDRALIVGEPTIGKALVMRYFGLPNGDQMMLCISRYLLPTGRCIQRPYEYGKLLGEEERVYANGDNRDHSWDSPIASEGCEPFITPNSRALYEHEGIIPDVFVSADYWRDYPKWYRNALWQGMLPYLQSNIIRLMGTPFDTFVRTFTLPTQVIETALHVARDADSSFDKHTTKELASQAPLLAKSLLAYSIWHDRGFLAVQLMMDPVVRRAVGLIRLGQTVTTAMK